VTDVPAPSSPTGDAPPPAFSAENLVTISTGRLLVRSPRPIRGAAVDSRLVQPGELFIALPGERTDGHEFIEAAIARGAAAVLVSRPPADLARLGGASVVLVTDCLAALHRIAEAWRTRFSPLVVGVTGSIAKTSTKEAVATVLARRFRTLKNEGNQNNEIGLPLTVLRLGPEHEAAVLEMGMYVGGEIADLARIGKPRIGVVTAVQAVHLSRIGTLEAIEQAKGELVAALPVDGTAILNADDHRVRAMASRTVAPSLTYGFATDADVRATDVRSLGTDGMAFALETPAGRTAAAIPTLGRMAVHNGLAAAAVGIAAGMRLDEIEAGLAAGWAAPHRAELVRAGDVTIIDDSYNASPGSVVAALELLGGLPGRRIAVLGEMLELGDAHEAGHRSVGEAAARIVDLLVVVGEGAGAVAEGARAGGLVGEQLLSVPDRDRALVALRGRLHGGDVVLVKASRGIALDLLVADLRDELMAGAATTGPAGSSGLSR
jgi:UDP-N-acetylmuramoyl-tripeptide--D-alanyl-D-alanine ligase